MRSLKILAVALVAFAVGTGSSTALMFSTPIPALKSSFQTVADMQMKVAVKSARLRAKPTTSSAQLASLKRGTLVDVIEMVEGGTWAHVKVKGLEGYVSANLLK